MSIQETKLLLIKKIINSRDEQLLVKLLQWLENTPAKSPLAATETEKMISTLLQNNNQVNSHQTSQQDIDELQQEVNELFSS